MLAGDVRGQGLMLGLEMVADRATKAPATKETLQVSESLPSAPGRSATALAAVWGGLLGCLNTILARQLYLS